MADGPGAFSRYIDPGTAGLVFGSLGGILVGVLSAVGAFLTAYFFRPLKRLVGKARKLAMRAAGNRAFFLGALILISASASCVPIIITETNLYHMPGNESRVIVIGIDAMDAGAVERMMAEGKLPNLKKLAEAGGYSRLQTTIPPETPVAWSAAATGANPGKYGIFDYVGRNPRTYIPVLNLANAKGGLTGTSYESAMKGKPFWEVSSNEGVQTTVIRWPVTFPPDNVQGRMLSGLGTVDMKGLLNSYSFYTTRDLEVGPMDAGRVVKVYAGNGTIETKVYGPTVSSGGGTKESQVPMHIEIGTGQANITVGGKSYRVKEGGWSDWMRASFDAGFMRKVSGAFRVYLAGTEPDFSMYMTSVQIDPMDPALDITYPSSFSKELAQDIGTFYTMGMPEDTKAVTEKRIGKDVFLEQVKQIEEEREAMFWHEFERFEGGILAFGFDSGDRLQHIFWHNGTEKEIEDYYMEKDAFIGKVLERIGKKTSLVIFSDHGFTRFDRAVGINDWLYENGYLALKKEPSSDDPGALFENVDWSRTKAYSLGFASIYVNLKGREAEGIVGENDKDALVSEIMQKLLGINDTEKGREVVTAVYRGEDVYDGNFASEAPDIVIGFEPGYRMSWQSAVGGFSGSVISENGKEWIGDHLVDRSHVPAVVFANFPIEKEAPDMRDIGPTVLSLAGVKIPDFMEGVSLA